MKLKFGIIGGGNGAFIGDVHRHGAEFDDLAELKAGCFTRNESENRKCGQKWGVSRDRIYPDYLTMAEEESRREDRIDFVTIATPNNTHYAIAKCFLEHGFHVMCDKPLAMSSQEGQELKCLAREKNLQFGVTFTYGYYTIIEQARQMIANGEIGDVKLIMAEYPQDWLAVALAGEDSDQAMWRTDPKISGISGATADIGSHLEYAVYKMTGLKIQKVLARLNKIPETMQIDNDSQIMLEYENGVKGFFWTSQIAIGRECAVLIRIYGDKGSIEWNHDMPSTLRVTKLDEPPQLYTTQRSFLYDSAQAQSRICAGVIEGYYEAFANMYRGYCQTLIARYMGEEPDPRYTFADVEDGVDGLRFVEACVESDKKGNIWVEINRPELTPE